jgi:hypothetical protein
VTIHPKTSGAALGSALGLVIVLALSSFHGIHLAPGLDAAIPGFLSTLGAFLIPSPDSTSTGPSADAVAKAMLEQEAKK